MIQTLPAPAEEPRKSFGSISGLSNDRNVTFCYRPVGIQEMFFMRLKMNYLRVDSIQHSAMRVQSYVPYLILSVLPVSVFAATDRCAALVPKDGVYNILRTYNSSNFQEAIDDFISDKNYATHNEAHDAGFSFGAIVYGVPLTANAVFTQSQRDEWKSEYLSHKTVNRSGAAYQSFEKLTLNTEALLIISHCIVATSSPAKGVNVDVLQVDDCHFETTLWYSPTHTGDPEPKFNGLVVTGGVCAKPGTSIVPYGGKTVSCYRIGRTAFEVAANTSSGSANSQIMEAIPDPGPEPPKPIMQTDLIPQAPLVVGVDKDSSYFPSKANANPAGDGGHELRVTLTAPGPITDSVFVPSNGYIHALLQNHPSTEDVPDHPEQKVWRGWTNSADPATITFTISYSLPKVSCKTNCDYDAQLTQWTEKTKRTCGAGK
jgi:hypothetical protein